MARFHRGRIPCTHAATSAATSPAGCSRLTAFRYSGITSNGTSSTRTGRTWWAGCGHCTCARANSVSASVPAASESRLTRRTRRSLAATWARMAVVVLGRRLERGTVEEHLVPVRDQRKVDPLRNPALLGGIQHEDTHRVDVLNRHVEPIRAVEPSDQSVGDYRQSPRAAAPVEGGPANECLRPRRGTPVQPDREATERVPAGGVEDDVIRSPRSRSSRMLGQLRHVTAHCSKSAR